MMNIQKTSTQLRMELNRDRPSFVSNDHGGNGRKARCNICKAPFKAASRYELFCEQCRLTSETYRFSDWLAA